MTAKIAAAAGNTELAEQLADLQARLKLAEAQREDFAKQVKTTIAAKEAAESAQEQSAANLRNLQEEKGKLMVALEKTLPKAKAAEVLLKENQSLKQRLAAAEAQTAQPQQQQPQAPANGASNNEAKLRQELAKTKALVQQVGAGLRTQVARNRELTRTTTMASEQLQKKQKALNIVGGILGVEAGVLEAANWLGKNV